MLSLLSPSTESCSDKIAESNGLHMTDVPQESQSKELLDLLVLSYFMSSKLLQRQDDKEVHLIHSRQSSLKVFYLAKDPRRPGICFNVYSKDLCMDTDVKQGIFDSSWRQYICLLPVANFLFRSNSEIEQPGLPNTLGTKACRAEFAAKSGEEINSPQRDCK